MKLIPVTQGQSLYDICVQEYGDVSYIFQLLSDNKNLDLSSNISTGDMIYIDDSLFGEPVVKAIFQEKKRKLINPVNFTDFEGGEYNSDYNNDYKTSD